MRRGQKMRKIGRNWEDTILGGGGGAAKKFKIDPFKTILKIDVEIVLSLMGNGAC